VAVTGWGQPQDVQMANEAGFDHHLVKPVEMQELVRLIAVRAAESRS
jgi:CheY-like chemotaxis protein